MAFKTCEWCSRTYDTMNVNERTFTEPNGSTVRVCSPKCWGEAVNAWGIETEEDIARRHEEWIKNAPHRRSKFLDDFFWEGSIIYKKKHGTKGSAGASWGLFFTGILGFLTPFLAGGPNSPEEFLFGVGAGLSMWIAAIAVGRGTPGKSREEVEEHLSRWNKEEGFDEAGIPITYDDF